jgi:hypothetical protein
MVKSEFRGCWGRGERLSSAIEKVRRGSGRERGWWGCHLNYKLTGGAGGEPKRGRLSRKRTQTEAGAEPKRRSARVSGRPDKVFAIIFSYWSQLVSRCLGFDPSPGWIPNSIECHREVGGMASSCNGEPTTAPQPNRWYDLRLGSSCRDLSPTAAKFCTLRCKPLLPSLASRQSRVPSGQRTRP